MKDPVHGMSLQERELRQPTSESAEPVPPPLFRPAIYKVAQARPGTSTPFLAKTCRRSRARDAAT